MSNRRTRAVRHELRPVFGPGEDRNSKSCAVAMRVSVTLRPVLGPGEDRNEGTGRDTRPCRGCARFFGPGEGRNAFTIANKVLWTLAAPVPGPGVDGNRAMEVLDVLPVIGAAPGSRTGPARIPNWLAER
ncbi:hypothetical protein [Micromonospora sp. NPDC023888]|uniref:hypothetical protein n=1 Tax=Micromonospora sp. NPDC023888 TaxID=3155607 RepID=UPI0033F1B043